MIFSTWQKVMLGDVSEYSKDKINIEKINIENYVSTENLLPNYAGKVQSSGLPSTNKVSKYFQGDILISNIRPYFKKIWKSKIEGGASNDVLVIKPKENIDKEYLYYSLANDQFFDFVMSGAKGTKMPRGDKNHIMTYSLNYPPIPEQKAIADILSILDEKIEVNNQINKTLENIGQTIFKQWFVDFEFPNKDGEPYKSSGGELVESDFGLIPEGWKASTIDDLTELIIDYRGKTPKKLGSDWSEKGIIALSAKSIKNGRLVNLDKANRVDKKLYSLWMKDELKYGDILLTSEAPLGELYFLANDDKYCLSQRLFAIRAAHNKIIPEVLYMYLKTPQIMEALSNRATGTTVTGIRQSELRKVNVIKPSINIQMKFRNIIFNILKKVNIVEKENEKLSLSRDALLPKLMTREIRVPYE